MKILNFGSCNIDNVYTVSHTVCEGETICAGNINKYPGGKGLNQSIALARAGAKPYHAGCIGKDGKFLLDIMNKDGVNTSFMKTVDKENGHAIIQVNESGDNAIIVYKGSNALIDEKYVDSVLAHFDKGDFLLLQNEISCLSYIVDRAYEKGMITVFNPSPFDDTVKSIPLEKVAYLILNETEAHEYCKDKDFILWKKENYPSLKAVLTLGKNGCIYTDGKKTVKQSAYLAEAVDTTGAGDTFMGYFIALISSGRSEEDALSIASAASAKCVSENGAASSIPHIGEVLEIMPTLKSRSDNPMEYIIRDYIRHNLKNATLNEIASILGYTPSYTSAKIKELMHSSFSILLKNERISESERLLYDTDMSIEEIAFSVGYQNESFFRKAFFEKNGLAPLKFRKERKKEG